MRDGKQTNEMTRDRQSYRIALAGLGVALFCSLPIRSHAAEGASAALPTGKVEKSPVVSSPAVPNRSVKPKAASGEASLQKRSESTSAKPAAVPPPQGPKVYPITSVFVKEELPEEKTLPPPPPPAPLDLGIAPEVSLFPQWAREQTTATQSQTSPAPSPDRPQAPPPTAPVAPVGPPEPDSQVAPLPIAGLDGAVLPETLRKWQAAFASPSTQTVLTQAPVATPRNAPAILPTPTPSVSARSNPASAPASPSAARPGQKSVVPKSHPLPTPAAQSVSATAPTKEKPLDLNTATRAQLMELPGVDGIRADLILAHRRAIGAFRTHTQLREVYGISDAIWEQVADRVTAQTGVAGGGVSAGTPAGAGNRVFRPALPQSPTRPQTPALPTPPAPPVVGR